VAGVEALAPRNIEVRSLSKPAELQEAVALQKAIWGFEEVDLLPVRLFVVAGKIGGHSFGAFHHDRMVGFCLAIPGLKPGGRYYLHSHMLGVAQDYRNDGIGRMLKLRQREDALARGIDLMEWTFDPLELKNAYFNIERLGAVVRRYVRNQYGQTTSQLHGGLPTDRCTAEWWLDSERVKQAIGGEPVARPAIEHRLALPADIARIKREEPQRAREIQAGASDRFEELFARDYAVMAFEKESDSGNYCFGKIA
jgi:predicted GNAT superfamily acetyltransferase